MMVGMGLGNGPRPARASCDASGRAAETLDTPFTTGLTLQNYSCVSFDETGDGLPSFAQRWHVSTCPQRAPNRLQTCCRLQPLGGANFASDAARSFAKVTHVNLCNVILDGILRRSIVRIIAHWHVCNLLDGLHLADSSTMVEVEGCGASSIPVSIVVLKLHPFALSMGFRKLLTVFIKTVIGATDVTEQVGSSL